MPLSTRPSPPAAPAPAPVHEPVDRAAPWIAGVVNRRILLLAHALRAWSTGGGLGGLVRNVGSPRARTLAARHILRVERRDEMVAVWLAGYDEPLFFPGEMDLGMLYQVLAEQMEPWAWHRYEAPETRVRPDDVVLDCGAGEGLFTFLVHRRARLVYAFEPLPEFRASLERTFGPGSNVRVVPAALGERAGWGHMQRAGIATTLTDAPGGERVPVVSIDDFCQANGVRATYIKADLEGYEGRVLRGARETIAANKPRIAITTYHRPGDGAELAALLRELRPDYQIRFKGIEHLWGKSVMLHAW